MKQQDLTQGEDIRGDYALFIESKHFITEWELDEEVQRMTKGGPIFFRVIHKGVEQRGHGWVEDGKVVQWG